MTPTERLRDILDKCGMAHRGLVENLTIVRSNGAEYCFYHDERDTGKGVFFTSSWMPPEQAIYTLFGSAGTDPYENSEDPHESLAKLRRQLEQLEAQCEVMDSQTARTYVSIIHRECERLRRLLRFFPQTHEED